MSRAITHTTTAVYGWFVWRKNGRPPRFSHPSQKAALTEAARLSVNNPGELFIVMKGKHAVLTETAPASPEGEAK